MNSNTTQSILSLLQQKLESGTISELQTKEYDPKTTSPTSPILSLVGLTSTTLPTSGFSAVISPLTYGEVEMLRGSALEGNALLNLEAETIYKKIKYIDATPKVTLSFEDWCKVTSIYDYEFVLLMDVYRSSFPKKNGFEYSCNNLLADKKTRCKEIIKPEVLPSEHLSEGYPTFVQEMMNEVSHKKGSINELHESSAMNVKHNLILDSLNLVITYQIPSLHKKMSIDKLVDEETTKINPDLISALYFIESISEPDFKLFEETGELTLIKTTDPEVIFSRFLEQLPYEDMITISTRFQELLEPYNTKFIIPTLTCPKCGHTSEPFNTNPRELLRLKIGF